MTRKADPRRRRGADFLPWAPKAGRGILVIGGGKDLALVRAGRLVGTPLGDDVTLFWRTVEQELNVSVTFVNGTAAILAEDLRDYAMVAVAGDQFSTFFGGLTAAEHDAWCARAVDLRKFLASGGGLLGFASCFGSRRLMNPVQEFATFKVPYPSAFGPFAYLRDALGPMTVRHQFREDEGTIMAGAWQQVAPNWDRALNPAGSAGDTVPVTVPGSAPFIARIDGAVSVVVPNAIEWPIKPLAGYRWRAGWRWYFWISAWDGASAGTKVTWDKIFFAGFVKSFFLKFLSNAFDPQAIGLRNATAAEGAPEAPDFWTHPVTITVAPGSLLQFDYQFRNADTAFPQVTQRFTAAFPGPVFTPFIGYKRVSATGLAADLRIGSEDLTMGTGGEQRWMQTFPTPLPAPLEPLLLAGSDAVRFFGQPAAVASFGGIQGAGTVVLLGLPGEDGIFFDPAVANPDDPTIVLQVAGLPPGTFALHHAGEVGKQHGSFDAYLRLIGQILRQVERSGIRVSWQTGGVRRSWASLEGF